MPEPCRRRPMPGRSTPSGTLGGEPLKMPVIPNASVQGGGGEGGGGCAGGGAGGGIDGGARAAPAGTVVGEVARVAAGSWGARRSRSSPRAAPRTRVSTTTPRGKTRAPRPLHSCAGSCEKGWQCHSHGSTGGGEGGGGGSGKGGVGGEGGTRGGGVRSGGEGGCGGEGAALVHVSSSLSTPGATCTLVSSHLSPAQQTAVPEQSEPARRHAPGGGGGGGWGGGGGLGGCGGAGRAQVHDRGRRRRRLPRRWRRAADTAACTGEAQASVLVIVVVRDERQNEPRTEHEERSSSRRRQARFDLTPHDRIVAFCAWSASSGTTATTGTSLASVGTEWSPKRRSPPRRESKVSCMPSFVRLLSPRHNSLNGKTPGAVACFATSEKAARP